jgi:hypothetical protein
MATIILSTNNNPDYSFYLPITCFVWEKFGFTPLSIMVGESNVYSLIDEEIKLRTSGKNVFINEITPYRSETIAQCVRLYAPAIIKDNYILTGDVDMIPLNSYFYRDFDKYNAFGYDLTDYTQFPMCYVGMDKNGWKSLMNLEDNKMIECMLRDLQNEPKSTSNIWEEYWDTDQHILTKRIIHFGVQNFNVINRGKETNGYAYKRVDRGNWNWDKNVEYIDAHLLRNSYEDATFQKTYELISHTLKGVDCRWMLDYQKKFKKIINE